MIAKFRLLANKARLFLAEKILPNRFIVQEKPFLVYYKGKYPDFDVDVKVFNQRRGKLSRDGSRWIALRMLLDQAAECSEGDYAELGTYQGRTARVIYHNRVPGARLFCFDTFEGFDSKDVAAESIHSRLPVKTGDYGNTSESAVKAFITQGSCEKGLVIRKGYFPDTAKGLESIKWRFVHLDCDLAAPTKAGLDFFWSSLSPGGAIVIHDFFGGFGEGIQNAFKGFAAEAKCAAVPLCDGGGSAVIRKPW